MPESSMEQGVHDPVSHRNKPRLSSATSLGSLRHGHTPAGSLLFANLGLANVAVYRDIHSRCPDVDRGRCGRKSPL